VTETAKLLTRPVNFAVVQLPGRQYPGVVVQGDSLTGLVNQLDRMKASLAAGDLEELAAEIEDMSELLTGVLNSYKSVCAAHSIS